MSHLFLSKKGIKGLKVNSTAIQIKTKQNYLMSPQLREVCRRI